MSPSLPLSEGNILSISLEAKGIDTKQIHDSIALPDRENYDLHNVIINIRKMK